MRTRLSKRCCIGLGLILAAGTACGGETGARPNILLVVVDTLRADRLGGQGYARDITPALDAFAKTGVRFERAYATAPWTQSSMASLLSGLEPGRHGLRGFGRLRDDVVSVAERLSEHGYQTAGVVSHILLAPKFGFDRGFDDYRIASAKPPHIRISTAAVTRNAVSILSSHAEAGDAGAPLFLFVHYFDPHYRYRDHEDIDFAPAGAGRLTGGESIEVLRDVMETATPEEIDFVIDLYDEEVHHTDAGIGRLLAALDRLGLARDTLVIVTADHGEELMERGWLGHTRTLYDELVRVPLIVRPPGNAHGGRIVSQPVSLLGVVPMILDFAGVALPPESRDPAPALRPLLDSRADESGGAPPVWIEVDFPDSPLDELGPGRPNRGTFKKAIVVGREKLIRDDPSGQFELYDLVADPLERNDLSAERPERVAELSALLDERLSAESRRQPAGHSHVPTEEERAQLEALGYLDPN